MNSVQLARYMKRWRGSKVKDDEGKKDFERIIVAKTS
jgi:hypothetical protein